MKKKRLLTDCTVMITAVKAALKESMGFHEVLVWRLWQRFLEDAEWS